MDKLLEFGRIIGSLTDPCGITLRAPFLTRRKTNGSTLYGTTRLGVLIPLISLSPPSPPKIQELIQGILVTRVATLEDSFLWPHNKGVCSVKSATTFLFQRQLVSWDKACWNWIWASPCPKKIQIFLWKALRDRLPTKTFLVFGRPSVDLRCPRCQYPETTIHILRDCPWAKEVWRQSPGLLPISFFQLPL